MEDSYPYEKRPWYPHMMPEDKAVWERYIDTHPGAFESCQYDVVVGSVPDFVKADPSADQASMERLYKKKIDVVAKSASAITIIELKPQCTGATIGQVKQYLHLYVRDMKPAEPPTAAVICGVANPDVIEFAEVEGVKVIVV